MPFKRPEFLRKIKERPGRDAEKVTELRKAMKVCEALQRMILTEGWKLFQARMQLQSSAIVARLQSHTTKDEEVPSLRHQLVGINMVQHVLTTMIAEGENAERQLKQMQDETEEVNA